MSSAPAANGTLAAPAIAAPKGGGGSAVLLLYLSLSAAFFSACAFAQLNDPDPWPWVADYVGCGALLNVFVWTNRGKGGKDSVNLARIANVMALSNVLTMAYLLITILPQVDLASSPKAIAWSILEFEQGRESAGLLLLLLHIHRLRTFLLERPPQHSLGAPVATGGGRKAGVLGTVLLGAALVGGVYLWVVHHPEMNKRFGVEHCEGTFREKAGEL